MAKALTLICDADPADVVDEDRILDDLVPRSELARALMDIHLSVGGEEEDIAAITREIARGG